MSTPEDFKRQIEHLRGQSDEFAHLGDQVYLDHAANGIYMASLVRDYQAKLTGSQSLFSNPHSHSQSGIYTKLFVDLTRQKILKLLNASAHEYDVVFVSNATHGLKLVAETFDAGLFAYLNDNHTSVVGMREVVGPQASVYCLFETTEPDTGDDRSLLTFRAKLLRAPLAGFGGPRRSLVAFPAQSNFNGRKYPLDLVRTVQEGRLPALVRSGDQLTTSGSDDWFVCLDTASYVTSSVLDLSAVKPDFLVMSFYKLFGFPTGVGALIVRKNEKTHRSLKKRYFGGGTIAVSLTDEMKFYFKNQSPKPKPGALADWSVHEHFEDGTVPYLDIIGVSLAIDQLDKITCGQGMRVIERYVDSLSQYCVGRLRELKHASGAPLVQIYRREGELTAHGPIVAFNLRSSRGHYIGYNLVEKLAQENRIHLRTGCFCNLGACQMFLAHLSDNRMLVDNYLLHGHRCGDHIDLIDRLPTGAIRVSFGYCTSFRDLDTFLTFLEVNFVEKTLATRGGSRENRLDPPLIATLDSHETVQVGANEYERQYFKITHLFIYPIKSCAPMQIQLSWPLKKTATGSGLRYDREWIVLDANRIQFTQKRLPVLSQIRPTIDLAANMMLLEFGPTGELFSLPFLDQGCAEDRSETVLLYGNSLRGIDQGPQVGQWLSKVFGLAEPCYLVRIVNDDDDSSQRSSFANKADFLLINQKSVEKIRKSRLGSEQLDLAQTARIDEYLYNQFRANIVVEPTTNEGAKEFAEESWSSLKILNSSLKFQVVENCSRCQMVNIDQKVKHEPAAPEKVSSPAELDLAKFSAGLLKKIYELKQNTKFGIYLSQVGVVPEDSLPSHDQLSVGQIGLAKTL